MPTAAAPPAVLATPHPGLSHEQARQLLEHHGPNRLPGAQRVTALGRLLGQLKNPMVALLGATAGVSLLLGEHLDAGAIVVIVVLNTLVGYYQEARADRALEALEAMTAPTARVRRDGHRVEIDAALVVPGDILVLGPGDVVAADATLLEATELSIDEAVLTGESMPVRKDADDPARAGTHVVAGAGAARVNATGAHTEMGRIAAHLGTDARPRTPLQERLERLTGKLVVLCLGVVAGVALLGWIRGLPAMELLLLSMSLAVASVPEGLPIVVTMALALGVERMAQRSVLVRRLAAVETLGAATVVCTDKTGTLTTGRMRVRVVHPAEGLDEHRVLESALRATDGDMEDAESAPPTEAALLLAAQEAGLRKPPRLHDEQPFSSTTKWMWVRRADGRVDAKGAPEVLFPRVAGGEALLPVAEQLADQGLRTIAVASGPSVDALVAIGVIGIADPPRHTARAALDDAHAAGIRPVMITGDHRRTARAIAEELGLVPDGADPDDHVFARATPEDKVELVKRFRAEGQVVAMSGDGVNDAPALHQAHVGIAMGRTGTEVTRQAADLILTDDDYAHIIEAIREGRGIDANIKKTLSYLLTGNAGELLLVVAAIVGGLPIPLLPLQLLWINVVTDGLPALALVTDPPPSDAMRHPPRDPNEAVLPTREAVRILAIALLEGAVVIGVFVQALHTGDVDRARTLAFTTLVAAELFRAFTARHHELPSWRRAMPVNRWLWAVISASLLSQVALLSFQPLRAAFDLAALPVSEAAIAVGLGLVPLVVVELAKEVQFWLTRSGRAGRPDR